MATSSTSPTPGEASASTTPTSEAPAVEAPQVLSADEQALEDALAAQRPNMRELDGVKFTGYADSRTLTVDDFKGVGVEAKGDLVFNRDNGFTAKISEVNADTLDYLLGDGEFEVVPKAS
jgi:hypothetical protein